MRPISFFLAGTMQGSRSGDAEVDQGYRSVLREMILARHSDAKVVCPRELLHRALASEQAEIRSAHATLADGASLITAELPKPIGRLRNTFVEITDLAASFDVAVAFLPGHEASMGTAAEMWSAKKGGAVIVSITEMRQNLAVLSMSDAIVPSVEAFGALLATDFITRLVDARAASRARARGELPFPPEHTSKVAHPTRGPA